MVKKVIGIISYLPDDQNIRGQRFSNLLKLLAECYKFEIPILIIAQNWTQEEIKHVQYKCIIKTYQKLGIVGARKELRRQFINSEFEYLIMLDDDCKLQATPLGIKNYLAEIDLHPSGAGEFRNTLLKLYAISKDIFSQVDFEDNISAESGVGFEDTIFVSKVRHQFKNKVYKFKCRGGDINETSINTKDPLSTWYTNQDLKSMVAYTHKLIDNMK